MEYRHNSWISIPRSYKASHIDYNSVNNNRYIFGKAEISQSNLFIQKKEDKLIMGNYRPISLLTSISKLFEKVVFEQLSDYLSRNKYFQEGQYSFREKHSTKLATVEWTELFPL